MRTPKTTRARGFTLIELLVVVAVITVIVAVLLAGLARTSASARAASAERSLDALAVGITQFKDEFGFLPPLVHDGAAVSLGGYLPQDPGLQAASGDPAWPVVPVTIPGLSPIAQLAVWSEANDGTAGPNSHLSFHNFIRRRAGATGSDAVRIPAGGSWDRDGAWDDRRYSKFALPFYLAGYAPKPVDGVNGPGMSRPLLNGQFEGALFGAVPNSGLSTQRDRYDPVVDLDARSMRLAVGYAHALDYEEHMATRPANADVPDTHAAFLDPWGRAVRYYRWEPGRLNSNGRLVVETTLDLNIPPVLINPEVYAEVANQDNSANARAIDLTSDNAELRAARYALVSAGPDGLFGTEPVAVLAERLGVPEPATDQEAVALRKRAWEDNVTRVGN